eukprot:TRINITY_DN11088_c0_g1_i2.p1 TRINITY_DN11088_c0_g1~~TRINITY_DN11088_c0_g1_i2.p1  ORF type:complete len:965 (-),score=170.51 TRINITY_DN11088_c0_g1_i2:136-3030(-)
MPSKNHIIEYTDENLKLPEKIYETKSVVITVVDEKNHGELMLSILRVIIDHLKTPQIEIQLQLTSQDTPFEDCYTDEIEDALMTAADNVDPTKLNILVTPFIVEKDEENVVSDALSYAREQGMLIVASAGNDSKVLTKHSQCAPANTSSVITCCALSKEGKPWKHSNYPLEFKPKKARAKFVWIPSQIGDTTATSFSALLASISCGLFYLGMEDSGKDHDKIVEALLNRNCKRYDAVSAWTTHLTEENEELKQTLVKRREDESKTAVGDILIKCQGTTTYDIVKNAFNQESVAKDFLHALREYHKQRDTGQSILPNANTDTKPMIEILAPFEPNDEFTKSGKKPILIYPLGTTIRVFLSFNGGVPAGEVDITNAQLEVNVVKQTPMAPINEPNEKRLERLESGEARKLLLFVDFYRPKSLSMSRLDRAIIAKELDYQQVTHGRGAIYRRLKDFLLGMAIPTELVGVQGVNGILFYGPPGTGKTYISQSVCTGLGMAALNDPIAGTEIAEGFGRSEPMLSALLERARLFPWLPCYLVIDELDTITPNRLSSKHSSAPSDHKQGLLAMLLTLLDGARPIKNLFLIGGTNCFSNIDPAFLRRMQGKFFVGLSSSDERQEFLLKSELKWDPVALENAVVLTANFSIDNLLKVNHRLSVRAYAAGEHHSYLVTQEAAKQVIIEVCRSEKVMIGNRYLPEFFEPSSAFNLFEKIVWSVNEANITGRIFMDLQDGYMEVESIGYSQAEIQIHHMMKFDQWFKEQYKGRTLADLMDSEAIHIAKMRERLEKETITELHNKERRLREVKLPPKVDVELLYSVFAILASSVIRAGYFQVITSTTLFKNKATDDKEAVEFLTTIVDECTEYAASLLLVDMDSIIGVDNYQPCVEEIADFSRIEHSSVTFVRPQLLRTVLNVVKNQAYYNVNSKFVIVLVTRDPNLREQARKYLEWPQSTRVREHEKIDERAQYSY